MKVRARSLRAVALAVLLALAPLPAAGTTLEVHPRNPRWLTADEGRSALVLSGAHTWALFQDYEFSPVFDAAAYLDTLSRRGHNFTRGWFWEDAYYAPSPYSRIGDRYRLSPPYDRTYVRRVRKRVRRAQRRDLWVSVMLFQGWSMDNQGGLRAPDPWPLNPYNRANTDEVVTKQQAALHIGLAQSQQLDYVTHLAGKLCSEPNIVWEVANEAHSQSVGAENASTWQQNILTHLRSVCDRHLTWVSCPSVFGEGGEDLRGLNTALYSMTAELVAPCNAGGSYVFDPPAADGRKVVLSDSDHYRPDNITYEWAWKAFLRGQHPLFMDVTQTLDWWAGPRWDPEENRWAKIHRALGSIQELVASVNKTRGGRPASGLADMAPQTAAGNGPDDKTRPVSSPWALFSSNKPCRSDGNGGCAEARANGDEVVAYAGASQTLRICRLRAREQYRFRWKRSRATGYQGPSTFKKSNAQGCLELRNPSDTVAIVHLERALEKDAVDGALAG